jgi:sucrose-phosphate synthase
VVATKNGGPSESLRENDKEYGVLVDPKDPADIGRGLQQLLCDLQKWEYFAQAGQQRVQQKHTWEAAAVGYLVVLEEMVSSGKTRPREEFYRFQVLRGQHC